MLAALQDEKYKNLIPDASRSAIQANLAKSAFVNPSNSDQLAWIIANQKNLVIKPRLEGRGDFVICGCSVTPEKWKHDVHACTENQWIVQEYIAPFKHRDILENSKSRTLAVYVIDGKACGMMSRVSSGMINNVAENGKIQPIFVTE
jgi:glutathione synthase/RimK-type ligase-like ATP-grasp enzyme